MKDRRIELQKFMKKLKKRYLSCFLILDKFEVVGVYPENAFALTKMREIEQIQKKSRCNTYMDDGDEMSQKNVHTVWLLYEILSIKAIFSYFRMICIVRPRRINLQHVDDR